MKLADVQTPSRIFYSIGRIARALGRLSGRPDPHRRPVQFTYLRQPVHRGDGTTLKLSPRAERRAAFLKTMHQSRDLAQAIEVDGKKPVTRAERRNAARLLWTDMAGKGGKRVAVEHLKKLGRVRGAATYDIPHELAEAEGEDPAERRQIKNELKAIRRLRNAASAAVDARSEARRRAKRKRARLIARALGAKAALAVCRGLRGFCAEES